jgi:hypothetical protein
MRTSQAAHRAPRTLLSCTRSRPRLALAPSTLSSLNNHLLFDRSRPEGSASRLGRRTFFGLGEVMGVLSKYVSRLVSRLRSFSFATLAHVVFVNSPAETLRSLSDAKKQLQDMQQELKDAKERSQSESPLSLFSATNCILETSEDRIPNRASLTSSLSLQSSRHILSRGFPVSTTGQTKSRRSSELLAQSHRSPFSSGHPRSGRLLFFAKFFRTRTSTTYCTSTCG